MFGKLKIIFISGLTALIPLILTVYIIVGLFRFADKFVGPIVNNFLKEQFSWNIPGIGILVSLLIIFIAGCIVHLSRRKINRLMERVIKRLPVISKIYFPIRDIVAFLFQRSKSSFLKVVLVEYPRKGIYSIGFIMNRSTEYVDSKVSRKMYNVFIPSAPSPLTGFVVIVPEDNLVFLDISVEEATKMIVSAGMAGLKNGNDGS